MDLLDDIGLAGIDDETGEVVCTLEEEDDTSDFVIFLSPEGRWLVYMDTDYQKVIQVRQIVSLLDSELLFQSRDHKTLELYSKDYDEVERSYTSDGKAKGRPGHLHQRRRLAGGALRYLRCRDLLGTVRHRERPAGAVCGR